MSERISDSRSAFSSQEYDYAYPVGIENHYWTLARNKIIFNFLQQNGLSKTRILEIGCGKGIVVHALRQKGIDCYGVEIASVSPTAAGEFIYTSTDAGDLSQDFRDGMETILLLDVIEHIEAVEPFLKKIKTAFANVRNFVVTVPAGKKLWSNYDEFYGHFRRYDLNMMSELGNAIGFKVQKHEYFFHCLYYAGILNNRIFKKREIQIKAPKGIMKSLHKIFSNLLLADYYIFPRTIPGSSIITLFQS